MISKPYGSTYVWLLFESIFLSSDTVIEIAWLVFCQSQCLWRRRNNFESRIISKRMPYERSVKAENSVAQKFYSFKSLERTSKYTKVDCKHQNVGHEANRIYSFWFHFLCAFMRTQMSFFYVVYKSYTSHYICIPDWVESILHARYTRLLHIYTIQFAHYNTYIVDVHRCPLLPHSSPHKSVWLFFFKFVLKFITHLLYQIE